MSSFGLIQLDVQEGDWAANLESALLHMEDLAAKGAQVLILPEMWTSFQQERRIELARFSQETLVRLEKWTRAHRVSLVLSQLEQDGDAFYNTAYVLSPEGTVAAKYRKSHLFHLGGETAWFKEGQAFPPILQAPWGMWSVAICFDLRFPIMFRRLARRGVACFIVPAQWPVSREDHWLTLLKARAIENQCVMIGVNRLGYKKHAKGREVFEGASAVFDPWGTPCLVMGKRDHSAIIKVDMTAVARVRGEFPCLELSHRHLDE